MELEPLDTFSENDPEETSFPNTQNQTPVTPPSSNNDPEPSTPPKTINDDTNSNDPNLGDLTDFEDFPEEESEPEDNTRIEPKEEEPPKVDLEPTPATPHQNSENQNTKEDTPNSNENPFGFSNDLEDLDEFPSEESEPAPPVEPETPTPPPKREQKRYENVAGFYFIRQNVVDLIRALQYGPVVVAHFVSEPFKFYSSGVFDGEGCQGGKLEHVNHASVIVGYDLDAPIPYFKFRNSWADDWGEKGHYRIKIGDLTKKNKGVCLVAGTPFMVFPKVQ
jgi:hypothetical protein